MKPGLKHALTPDMHARRWLLLWSVLTLLVCGATKASAAEPAFVVVTAPGVTDHRLSRSTVSRIFLRKQTLWENGSRIQPVNLPVNHPLRRAFSQAALGDAPEAFEDYWRDMYFHGVLPPHVLASEDAVVLFLGSTPGAIGYLSSCALGRQLTVVLVVGDVPDCAR